MLTDFHVHLRPDTFPSDFGDHFTAANAKRYREAAAERGIEALGVAEHVYRFTEALRLVTSVAQGTQGSHGGKRVDPSGVDIVYVIRR